MTAICHPHCFPYTMRRLLRPILFHPILTLYPYSILQPASHPPLSCQRHQPARPQHSRERGWLGSVLVEWFFIFVSYLLCSQFLCVFFFAEGFSDFSLRFFFMLLFFPELLNARCRSVSLCQCCIDPRHRWTRTICAATSTQTRTVRRVCFND